jgi:hypothetical protein
MSSPESYNAVCETTGTRARQDAPVIAALTALVAEHGRWGFWKCFDRLRLQGHARNHML